MRLTGTRVRSEEFDVSDSDVIDAAKRILCRKHKFEPWWFIKNGMLCYWEEYHHGSDTRKTIREATPEDKRCYDALSFLDDLKRIKS
jgi:hypothetical protein